MSERPALPVHAARADRGHSLLEVVVGLALAGTLAGLAIPSWRDYL